VDKRPQSSRRSGTKKLERLIETATKKILRKIAGIERILMAQQSDIVAGLKVVLTQLKKLDNDTKVLQASVDTLQARITELEAIIASQPAGTASQELVDAFNAVKVAVQTVDDNVPEVPTPPVV
jgi:predicted translin family RNA/ssDNA-binding protein